MNGGVGRAAPAVTLAHVEKLTLSVDVNIPAHDPRATTHLFVLTRPLCIAAYDGRCFNCGQGEAEAGPLEAHHHPVERCFATRWDWPRFIADVKAGTLQCDARQLAALQGFDWHNFNPAGNGWISLVDDMRVNGVPLCKRCHIGRDEGIHEIPYPIFIARKYAPEGTVFSAEEVIHHGQGPAAT